MSPQPSRRSLLRRASVVAALSLSGCATDPLEASDPVEPRETDPVRVEGAPITVTKTASSEHATVLDNGSVIPSDSETAVSFEKWSESTSVRLAEDTIERTLSARTDRSLRSAQVRWDGSAGRFLVTTTTVVASGSNDVAFPSTRYHEAVSAAPRTATVDLSAGEQSTSTDFPVYARAVLAVMAEE